MRRGREGGREGREEEREGRKRGRGRTRRGREGGGERGEEEREGENKERKRINVHLYVLELTPNQITLPFSSLCSVFPLYLRRVTIHGSVHLCVIPIKYHILETLQQ